MLWDMIRREEIDKDYDLLESVRAIADRDGWKGLISESMEILADESLQDCWKSAACVIYWSDGKEAEYPYPKMQIVARLYWCLERFPDFGADGENLVWS